MKNSYLKRVIKFPSFLHLETSNASKLPQILQPLVYLIELPLPHVNNLPQYAEATMDIPNYIIPYLKNAFDGIQEPFTKFLEKSTPDWVIYEFA